MDGENLNYDDKPHPRKPTCGAPKVFLGLIVRATRPVIKIAGASGHLELAFGVPPLLLLDDGNAWVYIRRGLVKDEQEP